MPCMWAVYNWVTRGPHGSCESQLSTLCIVNSKTLFHCTEERCAAVALSSLYMIVGGCSDTVSRCTSSSSALEDT